MLNVAIPPDAFTVRVPLTPLGVELIVTEAVEPATRFPPVSWIWTTIEGLNCVPAVPLEGGCVVNASLLAGPTPIVIELLVVLVSPVAVAVRVYVPVALNTRLLNAALPPVGGTVSVPLTPLGVEPIVMERESETGFPPAS